MIELAIISMALVAADPSAEPAASNVEQRFGRWEQRLRNRVTSLHVLPSQAIDARPCDVVIGFAVGSDGRPDEIKIRQSSCEAYYERHAYRLVRRLGRIGQIPAAYAGDHRVALKLSYGTASTPAQNRQLTERLEAERQIHTLHNARIVSMGGPQASSSAKAPPDKSL